MSDSLEKRLATRRAAQMATRKLTEQAILRRNAEIATFRQASYAQALNRAAIVDLPSQHPLPLQTPQPARKEVQENPRAAININGKGIPKERDRKSTRLNSSHAQ